MKTSLFAAIVLGLSMAGTQGASAQQVHLGVLGDSLSNEYAEMPFNYAKSWVELLAQQRQIDVGPTAAQAGFPSWNDLRGFGYQNNYAVPGQTTDGMVLSGGPTFLAEAVATRGVTHVVICTSGNDCAPWNSFLYIAWYEGTWTPRRLDAFADASAGNIREAVQTVRASGAHVILANMPDFGVTPQVRNHYTDPLARSRASDEVRKVNDGIRAVARDFQIPLVDLNSLNQAIFGTVDQPRHLLNIGGVNIPVDASGSATEPLTGFVDDGLHLSTVMQAIWANAMITGLNIGYGSSIPTFSDSEILALVGATGQTEGQINSQIGPYSQYVRTNFDCAADFNTDGVQNTLDVFDFLNAWFLGLTSADVDHSGTLDAQDIFVFLNSWMGGCP
jgi:lysophospholipase L1-like esterase